jgi:hypothetical protein
VGIFIILFYIISIKWIWKWFNISNIIESDTNEFFNIWKEW